MKSQKIFIEKIDVTCRIANVKIDDDSYEIDYDVIGQDVLVTADSVKNIPGPSKRWWLANEIEKVIRNDHHFQSALQE